MTSIFDTPRPTGPPRYLGPDVGSGLDLLPLGGRSAPSYPGARLRAVRQAQARRREEPYDGDRLLRDLRSVREAAEDPRIMARRLQDGSTDRDELLARGWTEKTIRAAAAEVVTRSRVASPVTAGAGASRPAAGGGGGRPAPAVAQRDRRGVVLNVAQARAAGYDPDVLWPGWKGRLASATPERPPNTHRPTPNPQVEMSRPRAAASFRAGLVSPGQHAVRAPKTAVSVTEPHAAGRR
jgi:hypothetical protein